MKLPKYINNTILRLTVLIGIFFLNYSTIYGQEEMEDASITVTFSEENDVKTLIAKATDKEGLPIEDLELYFFVKRTFSLLPVGDPFNSTDESGVIELEFPNDLPGDSEGKLTIVVKLIDSDIYNDLSLELDKNWGVPVIVDESEEQRTLWAAAANAPLSLIFLVTSMIAAVWYIICYIIFTLYKISRIKE